MHRLHQAFEHATDDSARPDRPHGSGGLPSTSLILRSVEGASLARLRGRLIVVVVALATIAGSIAQLPAALALTRHDPYGSLLNAVVWTSVGVVWIFLVVRHARTTLALWRLPSALFRASLAAGGAVIIAGRVAALSAQIASPAVIVSSLEAALYELGGV